MNISTLEQYLSLCRKIALAYFGIKQTMVPWFVSQLSWSPNQTILNRWNEHLADSILEQYLSLRRKFSALNHSTISSTPKNGVQSPKVFICFTCHNSPRVLHHLGVFLIEFTDGLFIYRLIWMVYWKSGEIPVQYSKTFLRPQNFMEYMRIYLGKKYTLFMRCSKMY